ncbi:hypothetical protein BC332_07698 [Capsicum chinense]|nr:hypothetical protein BC332_07698 [Capsicum chinense]
MGSRFQSHQLSSGLYVSGRPEQPKEKTPTMSSAAMPYTGGDIKKSGELGKMFVTPMDGSRSRKSGPINNAPLRTGSFSGVTSHSGQLNSVNRMTTSGGPGYVSTKKTNSGPLNKHGEPMKKSSGPQAGGVTCGNVPLESSFQKVSRCVYTVTSLYEYRGWYSKTANPDHRRFTWGLRALEVGKIV